MRPVNPYVAGAPLRGERGFFGRQGTLGWVAQELRNPATNALVLHGQRRIGKTTLLLQLERGLPGDAFLPVYFDLQDQATRSLGEVLADLADTSAERAGIEVSDPDTFDDRGRYFRRVFLSQLYGSLDDGCRPVFLLDEFDVLDQVAEAELPDTVAARALFSFLRRVMTEDPRPAFVYVVGRRAEDLSLDFMQTFKASLVREVWVLDRKDGEALVRQAEVNGSLRFTDRAVARILDLTHCHPYLTQLLCQRMWERAHRGAPQEPPTIDRQEVEDAVPDALEAGGQALSWLWNGLAPTERIYAAALAETAGEGGILSEDRVIQVLTAHAARLRTREVELASRDLVKRHVLEVEGERGYRFAVELFRRWVRQNRPLRDVKDELDRVEPMAGRLFEVGRGYFDRRQWVSAARYFRDALGANANHFRARLYLGEALLERGQIDDALAELERAYDLDRDEARLPLARACTVQAGTRLDAGDEGGALEACERALAISPHERRAQEIQGAVWTRRGDAALEAGDYDGALSAYERAGNRTRLNEVRARVRREEFEARARRGEEAEKAEEWEAAAAEYEWLAEQDADDPRWPEALERVSGEQRLAARYAEGLVAVEQERWKQAQRVLADVAYERPDYKEAARYLHLAVKGEQLAKTAPGEAGPVSDAQADTSHVAARETLEFCPGCGAKVNPKAVFCDVCGTKLSVHSQLPAAEPEAKDPSPEPPPPLSRTTGIERLTTKQMRRALSAFLFWLALFISTLPLGLQTLPQVEGTYSPSVYLLLSAGLAVVGLGSSVWAVYGEAMSPSPIAVLGAVSLVVTLVICARGSLISIVHPVTAIAAVVILSTTSLIASTSKGELELDEPFGGVGCITALIVLILVGAGVMVPTGQLAAEVVNGIVGDDVVAIVGTQVCGLAGVLVGLVAAVAVPLLVGHTSFVAVYLVDQMRNELVSWLALIPPALLNIFLLWFGFLGGWKLLQ